jgi:FdhE protein
MGYAPLPDAGRQVREALAAGWWQRMQEAKPDLAPAIALQKPLIGIVNDLTDALSRRGVTRLSLPPGYLTAKLRSGIPALAGEPVQLPVDTMAPSLVGLCRALADLSRSDATLQIRAAVEDKRLDAGALLTLALRREQAALRIAATRAGIGHDLLWLVADLAVSPFVHLQLQQLFGPVEPSSPLGQALAHWTRGYCPLCGSWPGVVEAVEERRLLRCGFCAAAWDAPVASCLYCNAAGDGVSAFVPNPARPLRSVGTCRVCRGYTKWVPAAEPTPFPLLAILDIDSMDLDLAAMNAGFARPALKPFGRK